MSLAIITGSTGLVGSETTRFLVQKGFDVIGIDNNERKRLFGNDGDTSHIKNQLIKKYKNYKHKSVSILNTNESIIESSEVRRFNSAFSSIPNVIFKMSFDKLLNCNANFL